MCMNDETLYTPPIYGMKTELLLMKYENFNFLDCYEMNHNHDVDHHLIGINTSTPIF